jgi:hypothetical protein
LGPKGSYTYGDVDAVEENLRKTVLDHTEYVNRPKKTMFLKLSHFAPVVLMLQWFLCPGIYGSS